MTKQEAMNVSMVRRWAGRQKYAIEQWLRGLAYRTETSWGRQVVSNFWEEQAEPIHEQWGSTQHDFQLLSALLQRYQPSTLLDVGCGSGRLFGLYIEQGVQEIVGMDLSANALALANARYPWIKLFQGKVEELALPVNCFELAICNRVLQHVPPRAIERAVAQLGTRCRLVYINELTERDRLREEFFMFCHAYPQIFAAQGFHLLETGEIEQQRYQVFEKKSRETALDRHPVAGNR